MISGVQVGTEYHAPRFCEKDTLLKLYQMQMKIPAFPEIGPYKPKYSEDLKPSKRFIEVFLSMDVFIVYQADINLPVTQSVQRRSLSLSKPNQLVF